MRMNYEWHASLDAQLEQFKRFSRTNSLNAGKQNAGGLLACGDDAEEAPFISGREEA